MKQNDMLMLAALGVGGFLLYNYMKNQAAATAATTSLAVANSPTNLLSTGTADLESIGTDFSNLF